METKKAQITLFLVILFLASPAWADTHTAASLSYADVASAVAAASSGDVVSLPSGAGVWTTTVTVSGKYLTMQGAGYAATAISGSPTTLLRMNHVAGRTQRVTGVRFNPTTRAVDIWGAVDADDNTALRIDNCQFNYGSPSILIVGSIYGVIHSCDFSRSNTPFNCIWVMTGAYDRGLDGGARSWEMAANVGGADAVYVENNTFTFGTPSVAVTSVDSRSGGRWVMRNNTLTNIPFGSHDAEIAGERGIRKWEFYSNTQIFTKSIQAASYARGGTGVIYGNRLRGVTFSETGDPWIFKCDRVTAGAATSVGTIDPWKYYCDETDQKMCIGGPPHACVSDSDCTGAYIGPCVSMDGQADTTGYICRDQMGAGMTSASTGVQISEPFYEWNNYYCLGTNGNCDPDPAVAGTNIDIFFKASPARAVVEGRDYITDTAKPGYSAYTYPHPMRGGGGSPGTGRARMHSVNSPALFFFRGW